MARFAEKARAAEQVREVTSRDREISKLRSQLASSEQRRRALEADVELAEARVDFVRSLDTPRGHDYEYKQHKPSGPATAVLCLGDWHVEETVDPRTVNGLNEFNLEIAERRIQKTFERAVTLIEAERGMSCIRDLVIGALGDFITGYIHEELQEENSLSPTEASLFVQDHLSAGIAYLRKHSGCKTITIVTAYGNHGRTTKKPRAATGAKNSYEWLLYNQMERHYRNDPRITWKIEDGPHNYLEIQGKLNRFQHGDLVQYYGGVGGITIPMNKAINEWNKARRADWTHSQHWHTHKRDGHWSTGGCLIGYNAYALSIKAEYAPPSQTLLVFDKDRPGPVCVKEVFCD